MASHVLRYSTSELTITFDPARCLHSGECVRGLPAVFDVKANPWIRPAAASADAVTQTIRRCPSGALQVLAADGRPLEAAPDRNSVQVVADGPLYLRGRLEVIGEDGCVLWQETRLALCRCGASGNKPLCDNSHQACNFSDAGEVSASSRPDEEGPVDTLLRVKLCPNGPLELEGSCEVIDAFGDSSKVSNPVFCRCGESATKPFCDGSHQRVGFCSA